MFLVLFVVVLVLWAVGWFAFRAVGAFIHLLLVIALIALVVHLCEAIRSAPLRLVANSFSGSEDLAGSARARCACADEVTKAHGVGTKLTH